MLITITTGTTGSEAESNKYFTISNTRIKTVKSPFKFPLNFH